MSWAFVKRYSSNRYRRAVNIQNDIFGLLECSWSAWWCPMCARAVGAAKGSGLLDPGKGTKLPSVSTPRSTSLVWRTSIEFESSFGSTFRRCCWPNLCFAWSNGDKHKNAHTHVHAHAHAHAHAHTHNYTHNHTHTHNHRLRLQPLVTFAR